MHLYPFLTHVESSRHFAIRHCTESKLKESKFSCQYPEIRAVDPSIRCNLAFSIHLCCETSKEIPKMKFQRPK